MVSLKQRSRTSTQAGPPGNFLRQAINQDLERQTYSARRWGGSPGDARHHSLGTQDWARIRTRFPPEPNGYLHIGHAKSISVNFGLAREYQGACHLRFDDTNPENENLEYVAGIKDAVRWLGFDWETSGGNHVYQASDYFDFMYRAAEYLIDAGLAYVDEQSVEQLRAHRGDFARPGVDSPFRDRSPGENLLRFQEQSERIRQSAVPQLKIVEDLLARGVAEGHFRRDVTVMELHLTIVSLCYYYLSNAATMSNFLDFDMKQQDARDAWLTHITRVVSDFLVQR